MADFKQYFRGETIQIKATPENSEDLREGVLLVYPDDLDLINTANKSKITTIENPTSSNGSYLFTIPSATTQNMVAGSYTVELYFGNITIVRSNRAFMLTDSGYALKQTSSESHSVNNGDNSGGEDDGRV